METQEILISIIPLILVVALLVYTARGITSGKGFETVRQVVPAVIVVLVAIAIIGAVSSAGGGGGDDPGDEGDVPLDMMIFEIVTGGGPKAIGDGDYAVLVGISEEYEVPEGGYRLVVPTTYQGYPVQEIGDSSSDPAFDGCVSVSSASSLIVNEYAFAECTSLASVSLPAAEQVYELAFYRCTSLASASFPAATTIGSEAFSECTSLASVSLPAAIDIGVSAF